MTPTLSVPGAVFRGRNYAALLKGFYSSSSCYLHAEFLVSLELKPALNSVLRKPVRQQVAAGRGGRNPKVPPVRVPFNDNKAFKPNHPPKKSLERFCGIQKVAEGRRGLGWAAGAELNAEIHQGYGTNLGLIRQESFFF